MAILAVLPVLYMVSWFGYTYGNSISFGTCYQKKKHIPTISSHQPISL
jgi:hypothetical protein